MYLKINVVLDFVSIEFFGPQFYGFKAIIDLN